ncbi:HAMP domain-containing sensor histidine kinase [Novosphingobium sp. PhB165]|uniref:sensor histidine kinase n=1 Tax=Novosphingobium sp. PhB165 TaxID=2485105 RepID=UPI001404C5FB|nr:HAMP domain-containing sensor histidine kinase [Novosphingobium sp. PhB165]
MSDCPSNQLDNPHALRALLSELTARTAGELVHDFRLDTASSTIRFRRGYPETHVDEAIRIAPGEGRDLEALAASGGTSAILHPLGADGGNLEVLVADNRGGAHWGRAVILRGGPVRTREAAHTIAHELRQPLFTISIAGERLRYLLARAGVPETEANSALERIAGQVERAQIIIARTLGQGDPLDAVGTRGPADLTATARSAVGFLEGMFAPADISVEFRTDGRPARVNLDDVALEQVFVNVVRNAIESIERRRYQGWGERGRITVEVAREGGMARATVTDNGAGLSNDPASITRPGHRTERGRRGSGLGLSICRDILAPVNGTVRLAAGGGEGAIVEITVPIVDGAKASDIVAP